MAWAMTLAAVWMWQRWSCSRASTALACSTLRRDCPGSSPCQSLPAMYVDACSNDLLVIMTDAAPICVGNLLPVRYFT